MAYSKFRSKRKSFSRNRRRSKTRPQKFVTIQRGGRRL